MAQSAVSPDVSKAKAPDPFRVLLVDDSAIIRGLIARILEAEADVTVSATASNGAQALLALKRGNVDVIVLDIEMPVMDGLTALPRLLEIDPKAKVIVASTLTQRNADISLRALQAGATEYIPKPSSTGGINSGMEFRRELVSKVRTLGRAYRGIPAFAARAASRQAEKASSALPAGDASFSLRRQVPKPAEIIAIGSSTGGPQALVDLLRGFDRAIQTPMLITQHMPPTFTAILSEHIAKAAGRPCAEAQDGEPIEPGKIYVAPGDWHMLVASEEGRKVIRLNQEPQENYCRPSVDPMLRSIATVCEGRSLVVMLTGMGQDGLKGSQAVVEAGGTIIAQDEASSVVWGMPGAVATAGLCSAVLPLAEMAGYIIDFPMRVAR